MVIKKKTILIIDDDPDFIVLAKSILEAQGMDIVGCSSINQARKYLDTELPNAILLDMGLQGEHGTDFLKERAEKPLWLKIPVVVCSAQNLATTVKMAIRYGADDYLLKPIKQTWLLQRVRKCLIKEEKLIYFFDDKEEIDLIMNARPSSVTETSFIGTASIGFDKGSVVTVSIPQPEGEPLIAHFKTDEKSRYSKDGPFETIFSSATMTEETKNRVKMLKTFWKF